MTAAAALRIIVLAAAVAAPALDPKAEAVVERTRTTQATYSVISWRSTQEPAGEWFAEFHSGSLHRVESSFNRIVADCSKMTGAALDLATGKIDRREWTAKAACGIQSLNTPRESKWIETTGTPFGDVDRISITDDVSTRTYDVLANGAVVRPKSGGSEVISWAESVSPTLPRSDIFSESSLEASVVLQLFNRHPGSAERGR